MPADSESLLALASERFSQLSQAEVSLLEKTEKGETADCEGSFNGRTDPKDAEHWGANATVRAALLAWLCTDESAKKRIPRRGIEIFNARVDGKLDLSGADVGYPLRLWRCALPQGIDLFDAQTRFINLGGCHCGPINASRSEIRGSLFLRHGFRADGPVLLKNARIDGDLDCIGGSFHNPGDDKDDTGTSPPPRDEGVALGADQAEIKGRVFLREKFLARGEVRFPGATIGGDLDCGDGRFLRPGRVAFNGSGMTVRGSVYLNRGFRAEGQVRLNSATVDRNLECDGGTLVKPEKNTNIAFWAMGVKVGGFATFVNGFRAEGAVLMEGASVGGFVSCDTGTFENPGRVALSFDRTTIGGAMGLRYGFRSVGLVRLLGAKITSNLECRGGSFMNKGQRALWVEGARVQGDVLLDQRPADVPPPLPVLGRQEADKPFETDGIVSMTLMHVDGGLSFRKAVFLGGAPDEQSGVHAPYIVVGGPFEWKEVVVNSETKVSLRHARVGHLLDDVRCWPSPGKVVLDGLVYDTIAGPPSETKRVDWLKSRLDWLRRQPAQEYSMQPYEQLAQVLRRTGHEADATKVLIAKQDARREFGGLGPGEKVWTWVLRVTIGYGYRAHWAFGWALLFLITGTLLFWIGHNHGLLIPVKKDIPTRLSYFVFSLDTLLPIINFHQEEYWIPSGRGCWGLALLSYYWFHIAVGWFLATLGVAGFTGLVRKD
jgi:hypothetical protein